MNNNNKDELTETFRFADYDCIGFDLDNTLARYKIGAMIEMEYDVMSRYLVEKKGYSADYLYQPFDHNFILRGLIVDNENGNIVRIAPDGRVLQAAHGTKMLTEAEIGEYYAGGHWEPADVFTRDPITTWNGPYARSMRTLLDYFDIASSLLFARAVDWVDEEKGRPGAGYTIWGDLQDSLQDMFLREHFPTGAGNYFAEMKAHPEKYYYKCSSNLLGWLRALRAEGKVLFLITGSHVDFASHTASNTLGPGWRELFDIVVCFAKKPGFFTMRRDFIGWDGAVETAPVKVEDLKSGGIYTHGNWPDLCKFLQKEMKSPDGRILYVGDNLVQDVLTPSMYSNLDAVAVCEELEAEGLHGHEQGHPDEHFLTSTVWGSYFFANDKPTNWYHIMKNHSKICVPSMEYVASKPFNHPYLCNKPI